MVVENKTAGVTLAGTLTLPAGAGPHPAVVLITGSGPQDRDEAVMGHRPFLVLADHLTRQGIAVLRCDDRGFGKSTGSFAKTRWRQSPTCAPGKKSTLDGSGLSATAKGASLRPGPRRSRLRLRSLFCWPEWACRWKKYCCGKPGTFRWPWGWGRT